MLSSSSLSWADRAVAISPRNVAVGVAIQSWYTARRPYQRKQPYSKTEPKPRHGPPLKQEPQKFNRHHHRTLLTTSLTIRRRQSAFTNITQGRSSPREMASNTASRPESLSRGKSEPVPLGLEPRRQHSVPQFLRSARGPQLHLQTHCCRSWVRSKGKCKAISRLARSSAALPAKQ